MNQALPKVEQPAGAQRAGEAGAAGPIIVLKGYFGHGNFGDDALLLAGRSIVDKFRHGAPVKILGKDAPYLRRICPDAPVVSTEGALADGQHLLIYCGGTQLFSFPKPGAPPPSTNRFRLLVGRFGSAYREVRHRVGRVVRRVQGRLLPRAAIGLGLGPFLGDPRFEENTRRLLRSMWFVSVRDRVSHQICREWGVAAHLHADLGYLPELCDPGLEDNPKNSVRRVGIIVRDWPYTPEGASAIDPLFTVAKQLRADGKKVTFILFNPDGDPNTSQRLAQEGESALRWGPLTNTVSGFLKELSQFDALITSRFHGAVFGSILQRPVVCVEIEPKLALAAELLGEGARLWRYPFEPELCLNALQELNLSYRRSVAHLRAVVKEQRKQALMCVVELERGMVFGRLPGRAHQPESGT